MSADDRLPATADSTVSAGHVPLPAGEAARLDGQGDGWTGIDLVTAMTLLVLLFHANETWLLRIPVSVLAMAGILYRPLARRAAFWWGLTGILAVVYAIHWDLWLVNHKYTMTYWCLAMACAMSVDDRGRVLAVNARLLIGWCFLFATFWKVFSPEFVDGTFFHFVFLSDHRFLNVAELIGGMDPQVAADNLMAINELKRFDAVPDAVELQGTWRLAPMALFMVYWTIAIEGLLALLFLWPAGDRLARWRNGVLIAFLLTTFPIATVQGFASLLALMGLAQCESTAVRWRTAYAVLFLMLPLFDLPLAQFYRALTG